MLKKEKQNANPVGANCIRPHFEGITLKNPKGITLIALIITIIVMLILVGVTINVVLTGGLFTKASEASKQMQVEAEKEELLSSVVAAIGYDGKVELGEIQLPNGWKGSNGKYTSPKGNTYTVDENGKITGGNIAGGNENTKTPLKQIKHGDVWKDVTFASMTLSDDGITLPVTDYYEEENGVKLEETIEKEIRSYEFTVEDECLVEYCSVSEGDYIVLEIRDEERKYIYYFFNISEECANDYLKYYGVKPEVGKFYCETNEIFKEMTKEEVNNIKLSGTISADFDSDNGSYKGYYDIPSQMATWFSGEVEYVD